MPDARSVPGMGTLGRESPELVLPLTLFSRYLQFLARRPISESNQHYRATRVAGLRSLLPLLTGTAGTGAARPEIAAAADKLRVLTPTNLVRLAAEIQRALRAYREPLLPRRYLAMEGRPDSLFFAGAKRVLILIGPAIGIGDEIITFPLPRAFRQIVPGAQVTVSSSYPQMWDQVDGVDAVQHYGELQELVRIVREGRFDLLVMVDFEHPGLAAAMCHEPSVGRYVELALGPRQMLALDTRRQRQWRMPVTEPNYDNYYDCVQAMLHWMGADRETDTVALMPSRAREGEARDELVIFANPFTSKEDPSERYWGKLLCAMLPEALPRPVRLLINTGPSLATRSLARALARTVEAHFGAYAPAGKAQHGGRTRVRAEVPSQPGSTGAPLSIGDVFTFAEAADLVVTADSFPAHAAQVFGRLTVVLGKPRTEPWRSPSGNSFYFSSTDPLEAVADGVRCLLGDLLGNLLGATPEAARTSEMKRRAGMLREGVEGIDGLLGPAMLPAGADGLPALWAAVREAQESFLRSAVEAGEGYAVLFGDNVYDELLPALPAEFLARQPVDFQATPELWWHLRRRYREWKNSNLVKYVLQPEVANTASLRAEARPA